MLIQCKFSDKLHFSRFKNLHRTQIFKVEVSGSHQALFHSMKYGLEIFILRIVFMNNYHEGDVLQGKYSFTLHMFIPFTTRLGNLFFSIMVATLRNKKSRVTCQWLVPLKWAGPRPTLLVWTHHCLFFKPPPFLFSNMLPPLFNFLSFLVTSLPYFSPCLTGKRIEIHKN